MNKVAMFFIVLFLSACSHFPASAPKAEQGNYFDVLGGGFSVVMKNQKYFYGINLLRKKTIPDGAYIVATFENPADNARPLVQEGLLSALTTYTYNGAAAYAIRSSYVTGIIPHRNYIVRIKIYVDAGKSQLLEELNQGINSNLFRN